MVLIDSPTDLMATASGQRPQFEDDFRSDYRPWNNIYLRGAYEKRVQDLEQFAREKTLDYFSSSKEVIYA